MLIQLMTETRWRYVCSECGKVIEPGTMYADLWTIKGKMHEHTWQHAECKREKP